jgi:hypothetical protein
MWPVMPASRRSSALGRSSPDSTGSALAKLFLAGAVAQPRKVQGLQLTHRAAWTSLLEARLRLPETALTSPGTLLAWATSNDGGPTFLRQAESRRPVAECAPRACLEWLRTTVGDAAAVVWQAWELGLAVRLLEVLPAAWPPLGPPTMRSSPVSSRGSSRRGCPNPSSTAVRSRRRRCWSRTAT